MDRFDRYSIYLMSWGRGSAPPSPVCPPDPAFADAALASGIGVYQHAHGAPLLSIDGFDRCVANLSTDTTESARDDIGLTDRDDREQAEARARLQGLILAGGQTDTGGRWLFDAAADEIVRLRGEVDDEREKRRSEQVSAQRMPFDAQREQRRAREQGAAEIRVEAAIVLRRMKDGIKDVVARAALQDAVDAIRALPLDGAPAEQRREVDAGAKASGGDGLSAEDADALRGAGWEEQSDGLWFKAWSRMDQGAGLFDPRNPGGLRALREHVASIRAKKAPPVAHGEPGKATGGDRAASGSGSVAEEQGAAQWLPKPSRVEPGHRWAVDRRDVTGKIDEYAVEATSGPQVRLVGADGRIRYEMTSTMIGNLRWNFLGHAPPGPGGGGPEKSDAAPVFVPGPVYVSGDTTPRGAYVVGPVTRGEATEADPACQRVEADGGRMVACIRHPKHDKRCAIADALAAETGDFHAKAKAARTAERWKRQSGAIMAQATTEDTIYRQVLETDASRLRQCALRLRNAFGLTDDQPQTGGTDATDDAATVAEIAQKTQARSVLAAVLEHVSRQPHIPSGIALEVLDLALAKWSILAETTETLAGRLGVVWSNLDQERWGSENAARTPTARRARLVAVAAWAIAGARAIDVDQAEPPTGGQPAPDADATLRDRARAAGAEEQRVTPEGYTQLPRGMLESLGMTGGGHLWFLRSSPGGRWEAWPADDLDVELGFKPPPTDGEARELSELRRVYQASQDGEPTGHEERWLSRRGKLGAELERADLSPLARGYVNGLRDAYTVVVAEMNARDERLNALARLIDDERLPEARTMLDALAAELGEDDTQIVAARWELAMAEGRGREQSAGHDWTVGPDGISNTSPQFERLCDEVARLIRSDARELLEGGAKGTARLIVAQLAHVHGLAPRDAQPAAGQSAVEPPSDPLEPYRAAASPEQRAACLHRLGDRDHQHGGRWRCRTCGELEGDDCAPPEALAEELTAERLEEAENLARDFFTCRVRHAAERERIYAANVLALSSEVRRLREVAERVQHEREKAHDELLRYLPSVYGLSLSDAQPSDEPIAAPDREELGRAVFEAGCDFDGIKPGPWISLGGRVRQKAIHIGERLFAMGVQRGESVLKSWQIVASKQRRRIEELEAQRPAIPRLVPIAPGPLADIAPVESFKAWLVAADANANEPGAWAWPSWTEVAAAELQRLKDSEAAGAATYPEGNTAPMADGAL